ncbi:hypothetical protein B0J11DRAFT_571752 [Dendryphion nanum]|uniref:Uncharacterized protein n=1 Tax=Dendryphion nanum TaxID=256645 RepID=A0A9P9IC18_9PLEO|nr:hypothetical protein B0J11DRAFT_571752 [Dendryphion nanum]
MVAPITPHDGSVVPELSYLLHSRWESDTQHIIEKNQRHVMKSTPGSWTSRLTQIPEEERHDTPGCPLNPETVKSKGPLGNGRKTQDHIDSRKNFYTHANAPVHTCSPSNTNGYIHDLVAFERRLVKGDIPDHSLPESVHAGKTTPSPRVKQRLWPVHQSNGNDEAHSSAKNIRPLGSSSIEYLTADHYLPQPSPRKTPILVNAPDFPVHSATPSSTATFFSSRQSPSPSTHSSLANFNFGFNESPSYPLRTSVLGSADQDARDRPLSIESVAEYQVAATTTIQSVPCSLVKTKSLGKKPARTGLNDEWKQNHAKHAVPSSSSSSSSSASTATRRQNRINILARANPSKFASASEVDVDLDDNQPAYSPVFRQHKRPPRRNRRNSPYPYLRLSPSPVQTISPIPSPSPQPRVWTATPGAYTIEAESGTSGEVNHVDDGKMKFAWFLDQTSDKGAGREGEDKVKGKGKGKGKVVKWLWAWVRGRIMRIRRVVVRGKWRGGKGAKDMEAGEEDEEEEEEEEEEEIDGTEDSSDEAEDSSEETDDSSEEPEDSSEEVENGIVIIRG